MENIALWSLVHWNIYTCMETMHQCTFVFSIITLYFPDHSSRKVNYSSWNIGRGSVILSLLSYWKSREMQENYTNQEKSVYHIWTSRPWFILCFLHELLMSFTKPFFTVGKECWPSSTRYNVSWILSGLLILFTDVDNRLGFVFIQRKVSTQCLHVQYQI